MNKKNIPELKEIENFYLIKENLDNYINPNINKQEFINNLNNRFNSDKNKSIRIEKLLKDNKKLCIDIIVNSIKNNINNLSFKEKLFFYLKDFLKYESEGKCLNCNNKTIFSSWYSGYRRFCCYKCSNSNKEIRERTKNTNLKKYGAKYAMQNKNIELKRQNTNLKKYGSNYSIQNKDIKLKRQNTRKEKFILKKKDLLNNLNIEILDYNENTWFLKLKDNNCNHEFDINGRLLIYRHKNNHKICTKCNNPDLNFSSESEQEILNFIKSIYNKEIFERYKYNSKKEIDIYIPDLKIGFEFNGMIWHSELYKDKDYHLNKTLECEELGIQLIHIWEDDWLYKQDIIKSMISNKLGVITNKIYARKCNIKEVSKQEAKIFLEQNHIQGNNYANYNYGLYYNEELVSLLTLNKPKIHNKSNSNNNEIEIIRFCNKLNTNIIGSFSKLLNHYIKLNCNNLSTIITFANRDWSKKDNIYLKNGFSFLHQTKPNYWYINNNKKQHRFSFRKDLLIKKGFDKDKTEHEIMLEQKIYRLYDCGSLKYELKIN